VGKHALISNASDLIHDQIKYSYFIWLQDDSSPSCHALRIQVKTVCLVIVREDLAQDSEPISA
jgi:hypothetical protein